SQPPLFQALAFLAFCEVGLLSSLMCAAVTGTPKSVLMLLGDEAGITEADASVAQARSILESSSATPLTVYVEHLDLRRSGRAYLEELPDWLFMKYRGREPSVIIAAGDDVVRFLTQARSLLWPTVPIVFAVSDPNRSKQQLGGHATGVVFRWEIQNSL